MNTQRQSEPSKQSWFYQYLEEALKIEIEAVGGQVDTFYSKKDPDIVQAFSVRFTDSPVAITVYPELLFKHWQDGLEMPELVQSVVRSVKRENPLDFSDYVIKKENAPTHIKASLIKIEGAESWLKDVPHEKYGDSAIVADWYFSDDEKITLHNSSLSLLQMTREELLAQAKLNSSLELPALKPADTHAKTNINIGDTHRHRR